MIVTITLGTGSDYIETAFKFIDNQHDSSMQRLCDALKSELDLSNKNKIEFKLFVEYI